MKALLNFFKPASRGEYNLIEQKKGGVFKNISSFVRKLLGIQKRPDVAILKSYTSFANRDGMENVFSNLVSVQAKDDDNQSLPGFHREESVSSFIVRGQGLPRSFNQPDRDKFIAGEALSQDTMKQAGNENTVQEEIQPGQAENQHGKEETIEASTPKSGAVNNSAIAEDQGVRDKVIKTLREVESEFEGLES